MIHKNWIKEIGLAHFILHKNWVRELGLKVPLFNMYKHKTFQYGLITKKQKRIGFRNSVRHCKQCFVLILLLKLTVWPICLFLDIFKRNTYNEI